jgi:gliding motility-associated-like protein
MQRIVLLLLILSSQTESLFAQSYKQGWNWVLGFTPVVTMNFSQTTIAVDTTKIMTGITFGNSCISDTTGLPGIFTNGFFVFDKEANVIPGGEKINTPLGLKLYDYYNGDGFWNQMSLILPKKNNQYYVFTTGMSDGAYDDWKVTQTEFRFDVLTYHVVDMDANHGQGEVVEKNKILMQDAYLSHNRMSAVRHANGRDWWLVKPHRNEQRFYLFLVQPDTIFGPYEQVVPFSMDSIPIQWENYGIQGQLGFSPNGEWMASTEAAYQGAFVYHFDRCDGTLQPYHFFSTPHDTCYPSICDYSSGIAFSPNSQFLYCVKSLNIWQADLSDTLSPPVHLSHIDTILSGFPWYDMSYLAPNGKVYIGNTVGGRSMCFIDSPDNKGFACHLRSRGNGAFNQPYTYLMVPPNMPHYTLGAAKGSACDTIRPAIAAVPQQNPIVVPDAITANGDGRNDSWHILNLSALEQAGLEVYEVMVFNRWGQAVFKSKQNNFNWQASGYASDTYMYLIRYRQANGQTGVQKGTVTVLR